MNVDVAIQVRLTSSRVPRKALLQLDDRNCLSHVIARTMRSKRARSTVICTSSEPIDAPLQDEAQKHGAEFFAGAPDDCLDRFYQCGQEMESAVLVRVCGDSPLVDASCIDGGVEKLLEERLDYVRCDPLPVGTFVEVFTMGALRRARKAAIDRSRSDDLTYFLRREEINRVGTWEPPQHLQRPDLILALNRPEDIPVIEAVMRGARRDEGLVTLTNAIDFLDANPEVAALNTPYNPVATRCNTELDLTQLEQGAGTDWPW